MELFYSTPYGTRSSPEHHHGYHSYGPYGYYGYYGHDGYYGHYGYWLLRLVSASISATIGYYCYTLVPNGPHLATHGPHLDP